MACYVHGRSGGFTGAYDKPGSWQTTSGRDVLVRTLDIIHVLAWGHTLGWVLKRLIELQVTEGSTEIPGRRLFLYRLGGITAAVAVFGTGIGAVIRKQEEEDSVRWSSTHPLPNAGSAVIPAPGTRPEFTSLENHYQIDIDTMPPHIHLDKWKLNIGGLVEQDLNLTMAEIKSHTPMNQFVTLECISNYIAIDQYHPLDRSKHAGYDSPLQDKTGGCISEDDCC